jgi:hypothetical protein
VAAGVYPFQVTITDDCGKSSSVSCTATLLAQWSFTGSQVSNDPEHVQLTPLGEATVDLNQGRVESRSGAVV